MNREEIFERFFELECVIHESVASDTSAFARILEAVDRAKEAAMLCSIAYQMRGEREIRKILEEKNQDLALAFVEEWLQHNLRMFSPKNKPASQVSSEIVSLMRSCSFARNCSELADAVASRYCVYIGLSTASPEYFYFEVIVRESLGLPGDAETRVEYYRDQFVCAEMLRELAFTRVTKERSTFENSLLLGRENFNHRLSA